MSIGVEEKSNTLVVSAPVYLIKDVMKLIREVDERAANQKVKVVQLNGVGTDTLRGLLSQIPGVTTNVTPAGTGTPAGAAATAGPTSPQPASQPGTSSPPSAIPAIRPVAGWWARQLARQWKLPARPSRLRYREQLATRPLAHLAID